MDHYNALLTRAREVSEDSSLGQAARLLGSMLSMLDSMELWRRDGGSGTQPPHRRELIRTHAEMALTSALEAERIYTEDLTSHRAEKAKAVRGGKYQGWSNQATWAMGNFMRNEAKIAKDVESLAGLYHDYYGLGLALKGLYEDGQSPFRPGFDGKCEEFASWAFDKCVPMVDQIDWEDIARAWEDFLAPYEPGCGECGAPEHGGRCGG